MTGAGVNHQLLDIDDGIWYCIRDPEYRVQSPGYGTRPQGSESGIFQRGVRTA